MYDLCFQATNMYDNTGDSGIMYSEGFPEDALLTGQEGKIRTRRSLFRFFCYKKSELKSPPANWHDKCFI
jgi:hypothetical protein